MNKTKIEWTDYAWNPIKGLCPHDCWYCYARKIYERFGWDTELSLETLVKPPHKKKGAKIFVCSTIELFHPQIKREWRDYIFSVIKDLPYFTFQILTKFPQNIDRPIPNNVWLGVSITRDEDIWRRNRLVTSDAQIKFISFEPLLGKLDMKYGLLERINWVIIGKLTQCGKEYDPTRRQLQKMVWDIRGNPLGYSPPIFLKNNLKEIWGEPLIQEFPTVV